MTPEELDEARAKEAVRRFGEPGDKYELANERELAAIAARLAREGWTPPEPEPVDPDLLAWREWFHERLAKWAPSVKEDTLKGRLDNTEQARAYLAGARMAREQERERAKVLVARLADLVERVFEDSRRGKRTGVNASEMISVRVALAKYRGEA